MIFLFLKSRRFSSMATIFPTNKQSLFRYYIIHLKNKITCMEFYLFFHNYSAWCTLSLKILNNIKQCLVKFIQFLLYNKGNTSQKVKYQRVTYIFNLIPFYYLFSSPFSYSYRDLLYILCRCIFMERDICYNSIFYKL